MSCSFVANKRSIGVDSKKLNTEIKIKTEPVDDDVAMGELIVHVKRFKSNSKYKDLIIFSQFRFT